MNTEQREEPGFAPYDLSDGRKPGNWKTRYRDPEAKKAIRNEAIYLGFWLIFGSVGLFLVVSEMPQQWLGLSDKALQYFNPYVGGWLAGVLGGTLFSIKWLYHGVAHNYWNRDRRLWRLFTPPISGALASLIILIVASGLFGFFDPSVVDSLVFVIALGFLTGYFSDHAAAKLADIATVVFGKTERHGEK